MPSPGPDADNATAFAPPGGPEAARAGVRWRPWVAYGAVGGLLLTVLRWVEYRYLVLQHSFEIYGGLVAVLFAAVGIWLGTRLTRRPPERVVVEVPVAIEVAAAAPPPGGAGFRVDEARRRQLGITSREIEVLGLIAAGLSTREIAGRLFVSQNTVKTHSSRLFEKLSARRRTEAVRRGKELGLIA
jgi:DNA-binding CsgD family transcriptional regulator